MRVLNSGRFTMGSTGAGILKGLLGESKYRGGHSQGTTW